MVSVGFVFRYLKIVEKAIYLLKGRKILLLQLQIIYITKFNIKKQSSMRKLKFTLMTSLLFLGFISIYGQASLIVPPGTDVTVGTGTTLDIGGDKLLLQDDGSTVPSFLQYGSLTFSGGGKAYVEQYLTKDRWHMVASPVSNEVIEVYLWNYLAQFDETTGIWTYLDLPVTIPLNVGEGYFAWNYITDPNGQWPPSPDSVVFDGTLNYQDLNIALSNTDASPQSGWNLLGNPYPVAIEWNLHADWNLNNVNNTMYLYDSQGGNYVTWNGASGTNPNGGFISATQGFWVRTADTTGTAASLTIPATQRSHNNATFLKSGGSQIPNQLYLTVEGNERVDRTLIGFMEEATGEFDSDFDGIYRKAFEDVLSLYSVIHSKKYALNELSSIKEFPIVPLCFEPKESGTFTLSAKWIESFPDDQPIYLEDKKAKVFQNLREQPVYSFKSDAGDDYNRFAIRFLEPFISDDLMEYVDIFSWDKTVYVDIPFETDGSIMIYDITGRKIAKGNATIGRNEIQLNITNGNYIVKLLATEGVVTKKVYIK